MFELTVTDDQGASDRDTVSVQVKPDPIEMNLLELTLNIPIWVFSQSQLDSLVQKMTLLLKGDVKVNVTEVRGEIDSRNTQIIFFLSEDVSNKALSFKHVVVQKIPHTHPSQYTFHYLVLFLS